MSSIIGKPFQPRVTGSLSMGFGDFMRFSEFVQQRFGLNFPEKRRTELEIGVRRAFSASTCTNLDEYFDLLQDPQRGALDLERLVNALTIGETYFFRDAGQFDALTNHVLPEIIERRKSVRTLRLWSAGCASGEEPYSLAMLLADMLPNLAEWSITILATDINTQNLDRARRGSYGEWAFRETRARQLRPRFFNTVGHNQYELVPEIRKMVSFAPINLASSEYPSYSNNTMYMDLILCRNVTIYFPEAITRQVIDRFYNTLVDDGWLVIGHSEHSLNTYQRFHIVNFPDAILYQRRLMPPASREWPAVAASLLNRLDSDSAFKDPQMNLTLPGTAQIRPNAIDPTTGLPILYGSPGADGLPATPSGAPALFANALTQPIKDADRRTEPVGQPRPADAPPPLSNPIEQAQALISIGQMEEAVEILLRFLTRNPNHGQACTLLGKTYAGLGNYPEAERWCHLAIVVDKLSLEAYYTLALVYEHQELPDQAIEMMKRVIYIDRNDILGYYSLAGIYHNRGQTALALKSLENARRLVGAHQPDEIVPRSDGITMLRLGQAIVQQIRQWTAEINAPDTGSTR
jgi:chemotaxis protein methyltransferase CheR